MTPLFEAARNNHLEIVKYLIEKNTNLNFLNVKMKTTLMNKLNYELI